MTQHIDQVFTEVLSSSSRSLRTVLALKLRDAAALFTSIELMPKAENIWMCGKPELGGRAGDKSEAGRRRVCTPSQPTASVCTLGRWAVWGKLKAACTHMQTFAESCLGPSIVLPVGLFTCQAPERDRKEADGTF